ncbi:hypothetical protein D3C75_1075010 [compost metagenome]
MLTGLPETQLTPPAVTYADAPVFFLFSGLVVEGLGKRKRKRGGGPFFWAKSFNVEIMNAKGISKEMRG